MSKWGVGASPEATDDVLSTGSLVEGFRVLRLLGEGASGRVYLAQDLSLGRHVALKLLRPELLGPPGAERMLEEARTTARFSHPHIVTVHAAGVFKGQPYLALEYLEGETLRERMSRERLRCSESGGPSRTRWRRRIATTSSTRTSSRRTSSCRGMGACT